MYKYEHELVNDFLKDKFNNNYIEECSVRWGNIDVVNFDFSENKLLNQQQIDWLLIQENLYIFSKLYRNRAISIKTIASNTNIDLRIIDKKVRKMFELDICEVNENKLIRISSNIEFPNIVVTGYEMKLKNIKGVISQGVRNKEYCDYSYIVVPVERRAVVEKYKEILIEQKVGVILMEKGTKKILIRAKKSETNNSVKNLHAKLNILKNALLMDKHAY